MAHITLTLDSIIPWDDRIESLIRLLDKHTIFRPDKWDAYEPVKKKFTQADLPKMQHQWSKYTGFLLQGKKPAYDMQLVRHLQFKKPNWLAVHINEEFFNSANSVRLFLDFAKELFEWGDIIYGYACHREDFAKQNKLPKMTLIEGKAISTGGMDLRKCLPGVYWANFFSKAYIDWFGKEKTLLTPCYALEELPRDGLLILTSHTPTAYEEAEQIKKEIRVHLGEDVFFDVDNPIRPCRSPFLNGQITL